MGLNNFILECEKHNKELIKDVEYYKRQNKRLKEENIELKTKLKYWVDIYTDLKKWLEEKESFDYCCNETTFTDILNKMQELEKESD